MFLANIPFASADLISQCGQSVGLIDEGQGANDQFVEKCIIVPQLIKINVIKTFSGVFQYCWEKIICLSVT